MTPSDMRTRAKEFKTEGKNVQNVITKMDKLIARLEKEWKGQAATAFKNQYNDLKPSFTKMKTLIDDISKQLDGTAKAMEDMDKEIAGKFGVK
jgi:WXG100 family type VII secretion target